MNKRPVIICTDPGIDDFIALTILLRQPQLDIRGMIALSGNVGLPVTVNNTLLAGELCGRTDVPVLAGSAKPLARPARTASNIHGASGLGKSSERYSQRKPLTQAAAERMGRRSKAAIYFFNIELLHSTGSAVLLCILRARKWEKCGFIPYFF